MKHNPEPLKIGATASSDSKTLNEDVSLPFNQGAFQIIVSMLPPEAGDTTALAAAAAEADAAATSPGATTINGISVTEIARLLGDKGFVLLGAPQPVWEGQHVTEQINDSQYGLTMLSLQAIPCENSKYYLCLARKEGL